MIRDDVGIVFIASIIEGGSDLDFERKDASDYLIGPRSGKGITEGERKRWTDLHSTD